MATYTINTTVKQDALLAKLLVRINLARALASQPPLTVPQLASRIFADNMDGHTSQDDSESSATMFTAFAAANPSVQASVKSQLGIT